MLINAAGESRGDGDNDGLGRKKKKTVLRDTIGRPVGRVGGFIGEARWNKGGWSTQRESHRRY